MKTVLFVCVHNAGRSQMAEAFTNKIASERGLPVRALSAGTIAGEKVNPVAAAVMQEIGTSMEGQTPKQLTQAMADQADRIITMGCGVDADACPARIHVSEDWGLDDPAGQPLETVRRIRDQIKERVEKLILEVAEVEGDDASPGGPPIACSLNAFSPGQQRRHGELVANLHGQVREVRELPNGYAFIFPSEQAVCSAAMEFALLERLCCPFFRFSIELAPRTGPLALTITGPHGAKQILESFVWRKPCQMEETA